MKLIKQLLFIQLSLFSHLFCMNGHKRKCAESLQDSTLQKAQKIEYLGNLPIFKNSVVKNTILGYLESWYQSYALSFDKVIKSFALSPDGSSIAVACYGDLKIVLWNLRENISNQFILEKRNPINLQFSSCGDYLIINDADGISTLGQVCDGNYQVLKETEKKLKGASTVMHGFNFSLGFNYKLFITNIVGYDRDNSLISSQQVLTAPSKDKSLNRDDIKNSQPSWSTVSKNGLYWAQYILSSNSILIFDTKNMAILQTIALSKDQKVHEIALSPRGIYIAVNTGCVIDLYVNDSLDPESKSTICEWKKYKKSFGQQKTDSIHSTIFSPNGQFMAWVTIGSEMNQTSINILEFATGLITELSPEEHGDIHSHLAFTADSRFICAGLINSYKDLEFVQLGAKLSFKIAVVHMATKKFIDSLWLPPFKITTLNHFSFKTQKNSLSLTLHSFPFRLSENGGKMAVADVSGTLRIYTNQVAELEAELIKNAYNKKNGL